MKKLFVVLMTFPLILAALPAAAQQVAEGRLAQLYAPRPPAGSAFVRVINPGANTLKVGIANGSDQVIGASARATRYAIVEGGKPFEVRVDGRVHSHPQVAAGSFTSLVLDANSAERPWKDLNDGAASSDALKAQIRFYNLAPACGQGQLALAGNGPVVFSAVPAGSSSIRAINPVRAQLVPSCDGKAGAAFELPALQPGDHYSLFLVAEKGMPVLRGQLSGTDAVRR